jgi:outer membrane beta-barrel protein
VALLASTAAWAEETKHEESLDSQLEALSLPENQSPVPVSQEKLYSVQSRYATLKSRHELSVGFAKNMTPPSYLSSQQIDATYRFHLSDRFSLGVGGSYVFNTLTDAGEHLRDIEGIVPDAAYVKYRANFLATYNLFYGKFRVSMDRVFYFDQYLSLGPGYVVTDLSHSAAAVGDIGLALWLGRTGSIRIGLKDYYFHEVRHLSASNVQDIVFHVDLGILLGQGGST